jgi:4'-phosphopantetheinyl transferase
MNLYKEIPDFFLPPETVHVWLFRLDGSVDPARKQSLAQEEIVRAKQYKHDVDRTRFTARRGILRQLLSRYSGVPATEIRYRTNPHGKLSVFSGSPSFNLSTCQDWVAYAFAEGVDIGVDIECVRPLPELSRIVERFFSPDERDGLSALAASEQIESFYHIWIQKEAFIKAHGEGLAWPLEDFSVSVSPNQPGKLLSIRNNSMDVSHWKMACIVPENGWLAAVCAQSDRDIEVLCYMPDLADFVSSFTSR